MNRPKTTEPALLNLLERAREAALNAYAPYSGFRVGAALRLAGGEIVTGANVENVSYGLTICAERAALVRAVSQFGPAIRVQAVAVANLNSTACPPCGACRQMLAEFTQPEAQAIFPDAEGGEQTISFRELLPLPFAAKLKQEPA
jgi:homotetrameric cytidine deaminase